MTYIDQFNLTQDTPFRNTIQQILVKVALDVQGESQAALTTKQWNKRGVYAARVLGSGADNTLDNAVSAVVADLSISNSSTDAVLESRITAIFDDLASVTGEDLV